MYNEESVVSDALAAVGTELEKIASSFEILCVNDGSTDRTSELLLEASRSDPRIVPIELSRNFGKEAAMAAGLDHARGDAVLLMDADLQHPSHLIPDMVRAWNDGADVVNVLNGPKLLFGSLLLRASIPSWGGAMAAGRGPVTSSSSTARWWKP